MMGRESGVINRREPDGEFLSRVEWVLERRESAALAFEDWLQPKTESQLDLIATGEEGEVARAIVTAPEGAEGLLEELFEEAVCGIGRYECTSST